MSTERYTISGSQLVEKVKQLIREGNIRRVRVIYKGQVMLEMPLTVGAGAAAVGVVFTPLLAALGAFAALITDCTLEVDKVDKPGEKPGADRPQA